MTTQTMEKGPQKGTGARERASVVVAPEPIYPACKKLKAALSCYSSAEAELEAYRGKVAKAQSDMDMLGDSSESEADSLRAISDANGRRSLYASRVAGMERKTAGLAAELRTALVAAVAEVTRLVGPELERRFEILSQRVIEAIGGFNEHAIIRGGVASIVRHSKLIFAVERLRPTPLYNADNMPAADVVAHALATLKSLELLTPEIGREI